MTTHLTIVVENTAGHGTNYQAEHGLSFWIETENRRILFDTGQSDLIALNAEKLGVDLTRADGLVLSHGHYDHTGGIAALLEIAGNIDVWGHPGIFETRYSRKSDGSVKYNGILAACATALKTTSVFKPVETAAAIGDGLSVTGPIPRRTDFEDTGGPFFLDEECLRPDPIVDDQAAFFESKDGVIVVLGCAHSGVVNTLRHVHELVSGKSIHTVIGGAHLLAASEERMDKTVAALREFDVKRLIPLHCTGFAAAARLRDEFPGRVEICPVGTTLRF